MINTFNISTFLKEADSKLVIDVRSPGEFKKGNIPGAVNLPLFDDGERALVGTIYKEKGRKQAFLKGLDIAGPKMSDFVRKALAKTPGWEILVHCWRGGMRSESMAWLLDQAGFEVSVLTGGYKSYRRKVLKDLERPLPLLIIGGKTGTGKTDVLKALEKAGKQVIDLEGLAHHKGSVFGGLGQSPQPTVEQFENDLHSQLSHLNYNKPVWVEDESAAIGKVHLPKALWEQMKTAPVYELEVPLEIRVNRLVEEYSQFPEEELAGAIRRISKRLGGKMMQEALLALDKADFAQTARICLLYYDKTYSNCLARRDMTRVYALKVQQDDPVATAHLLLQSHKEKIS